MTVAYRQHPKGGVWHKLHLAVDPLTHDIVVAEVSLENIHDAEVLPTLLKPLQRNLRRVYADVMRRMVPMTAKPVIGLFCAKE